MGPALHNSKIGVAAPVPAAPAKKIEKISNFTKFCTNFNYFENNNKI